MTNEELNNFKSVGDLRHWARVNGKDQGAIDKLVEAWELKNEQPVLETEPSEDMPIEATEESDEG